jgi:hypothetical protein
MAQNPNRIFVKALIIKPLESLRFTGFFDGCDLIIGICCLIYDKLDCMSKVYK